MQPQLQTQNDGRICLLDQLGRWESRRFQWSKLRRARSTPCLITQPTNDSADNAFKVQWELFLRHVVKNEPFPWSLREGAKGVQLAELGLQSWAERRWLDVPAMK